MTVNAPVREPDLTAHTCWALLRSTSVGRLAVHTVDGIDIFPINYVVDHGSIVFRTADGTKLLGAVSDAPVAFESDGTDPKTGEAWSVVVKGQAHLIRGIGELRDTQSLPLFPWHSGPKQKFVRVEPDHITGRRFRIADPSAWATVMSDVPRAGLE